jgi:hypothetical protein
MAKLGDSHKWNNHSHLAACSRVCVCVPRVILSRQINRILLPRVLVGRSDKDPLADRSMCVCVDGSVQTPVCAQCSTAIDAGLIIQLGLWWGSITLLKQPSSNPVLYLLDTAIAHPHTAVKLYH